VKIFAAQKIYGNKWAIICKLFPGRSDNQVKNHFHVMMARMQRQQSSFFFQKRNPIFQTPPMNNVAIGSACTLASRFTRPLLNCQAYGSQIMGMF
jgi:myb proto-oncogene protein